MDLDILSKTYSIFRDGGHQFNSGSTLLFLFTRSLSGEAGVLEVLLQPPSSSLTHPRHFALQDVIRTYITDANTACVRPAFMATITQQSWLSSLCAA